MDGAMISWPLGSAMRSMSAPGSKPSTIRPDRASSKIAGFNDSVPWGDQLLASATNSMALFSLDRKDLHLRGYIPFSAPKTGSGTYVIPANLSVSGDVAYLTADAGGDTVVYRIELTTGNVRSRVIGAGSNFPPVCAVADRVYVGVLKSLVELDGSDLHTRGSIAMSNQISSIDCSSSMVYVGLFLVPELDWVDPLTFREVARSTWLGKEARAVLGVDRTHAIAVDNDAGMILWCALSACTETRTDRQPMDIVRAGASYIVLAKPGGSFMEASDVIDVLDSQHRFVGHWASPPSARGPSFI